MDNQWQIQDDNGVIEQGTEENIKNIWDLTTMDITDLAEKYKDKYKRSTLKAKIVDYAIDSWVGDLQLVEIHGIHK